jgi:hypothetical protein
MFPQVIYPDHQELRIPYVTLRTLIQKNGDLSGFLEILHGGLINQKRREH